MVFKKGDSINKKHGHFVNYKASKTYTCWSNMKKRCQNPRDPAYKHYGERGIRVCERWQMFENFLLDMGEIPDGLEIDRIDNNGDYEPSNCRLITKLDNLKNRRINKNARLLKHNNMIKDLYAWCDYFNIKRQTGATRWYRWGTLMKDKKFELVGEIND